MTNIVLDRTLTVDEAQALRPALLAFREHSSYPWYTEDAIDVIIRRPQEYSGRTSALLGNSVGEYLNQFQTYAREHTEQVQEWLAEPVSHGETVAEPTDRSGLARAMMTSRRREAEANEALLRRNEQYAALQADLAEVRALHANQAASIIEMQAENRRLAANGITPQPGRNWYDLGFRSQGDYRAFCIKAATSAAENEHCPEYDEIASDIGLLDREDLAEEKEVRIVIETTITVPLGRNLDDLDEGDLEEAVENWVRHNSISGVIEEV